MAKKVTVEMVTLTPNRVVVTAARVVLWAFLLGGALAGFVSAAVLFETVGSVQSGERVTPLSRKVFVDMLLRNAEAAAKAQAQGSEKKP